ncbi:hypothetical protein GA0116948_11571 [Chitinophaga costaii]|uniref:Uncharacterized protein n=1 Tax=Chitinophaga costaii TaxID=1335309 RepID=A0A1C4FLT9_9BACT|nr:hypothetical protein [Chitinophaga costaii]PUZ29951.1 hypothetical protein DCM91_00250 [Chitinophaga costaii]SCC56969.1 hypothetical protein GA0116948_11571 [Chitinophaga costaii]
MKAASIADIKKELTRVPTKELVEMCLRIAKYKKENKELLAFLLFDADDLPRYIASVKSLLDEEFAGLKYHNLYLAKKMLRRILRLTNKHIKYTGSKPVEIELLLYFCQQSAASGVPIRQSIQLGNMYDQLLKKIRVAIETQHEDLQYDYRRGLEAIRKEF